MAKDIKLGIVINQSGNAAKNIGGISATLGKLGGIAGGVLTGGLVLAGAGVVALGAGLVSSVGAAMDAQQGQAQLASVLKSTNGVSGMTADSINDLASSLQNVTTFEDDAILAGQNMLLTFTNIGKEVFPQATETILDMAQALGGDTVSNAKILGKALNDPVAGLTALGKAGVQFTDAQKDMITAMVDAGDTVGAQKMILAELETQIGGSAKAAGETLPGKLAILQNTFGDIQETIGGAFLPILSEVADMFTAGLHSEFVQGALESLTTFITGSVVPGIKSVGEVLKNFIKAIVTAPDEGGVLLDYLQELPAFLQPVASAFGNFAIFLTDTVVPGIKTAADILRNFIKVIITAPDEGGILLDYLQELPAFLQPVASALGNLAIFLQDFTRYILFTVDSGDSLNDWLSHLPDAIQPAVKFIGDAIVAFQDFGNWFINQGIPNLQAFASEVLAQLIPGLKLLGQWVTTLATSVWPLLVQAGQFVIDNFNIIGPIIAAVGAVILALSSPITAIIAAAVLLATAWANNWGGIQERTQAVLDFLQPKFNELAEIFNQFITLLLPELQAVWQELTTVWQAEVQPALADLWTSLQELFTALGFGAGKTTFWKATMETLKITLAAVLTGVRLLIPVIRFYADGLSFMIGQVKMAVDNFVRFKNGVEGIVGAVGRLISRIREAARSFADLAIPDWLTPGSPTPFEIGLKGIAGAARGVAGALPQAFSGAAGPSLAGAAPALSGAGPAAGGLIIQFTYAPVISLADRYEAQNVLAPFIAEGVRAALAGKRH